MRSLQGAIQELYSIKISSIGYSVYLRTHCHKFGSYHQPLRGIIRACSGLFCKLLHADELFVNNAQGPVCRLDERDSVIGIARPLMQGCNLCPLQFPDGKAGGVISCGIDAQTRGKPLG